jgi:hypothetical protein
MGVQHRDQERLARITSVVPPRICFVSLRVTLKMKYFDYSIPDHFPLKLFFNRHTFYVGTCASVQCFYGSLELRNAHAAASIKSPITVEVFHLLALPQISQRSASVVFFNCPQAA